MAIPFSKIRSKLNRAVSAWLISGGVPGLNWNNCLQGNGVQSKIYPYVLVRATTGREEFEVSGGIYRVQVAVYIRGSAANVDPTNQAIPVEQQRFLAQQAWENMAAYVDDQLKCQESTRQSLLATALAITQYGNAMAVPYDQSTASLAFAARNADMADFTCSYWYDKGFGDGEPEEAGCDWEEILLFEAQVSPKGGLLAGASPAIVGF